MTDNRRMTTDRFYGGVSNRLQNLRSMLEYVRSANPPRSDLNDWVISNTTAGSPDAVSHHLTFLASIDLIELAEDGCVLGEYGVRWLDNGRIETLFNTLSLGVVGFDAILHELYEREMTDEDIMNLLVSEFDEAEMTTPGPAVRHREWLQVVGLVKHVNGVNKLTENGETLIQARKRYKTINVFDSSIESGDTFLARLDRISGNSNGIIEWKRGASGNVSQINIGPIKPKAVGRVVQIKKIGGIYGHCQTQELLLWEKTKSFFERTEYSNIEKYEKDKSIYLEKPVHIHSTSSIPTSRTTTSNNTDNDSDIWSSKQSNGEFSTNTTVEFCDECGSMLKLKNNTWKCSSCEYEKTKYEKDNIREQILNEKNCSNVNLDNNKSNNPDTNCKQEINSKNKRKLDMQTLRKEAEEDAVDEVEQTTTATTSTKSQYNRSRKVKEYVKARADGNCEGCGEPAPFTSTTGEPYLHAHHVHELSDGGSDTPDTVIALCPNCHYRVHHGEDGDEYNQELLEIVREKESKQ